MKNIFTIFTLIAVGVCVAVTPTFGESATTDGAKIGEWTQDYDAALRLANSNNLPILLNFSGSDWCFWCKHMEKRVFSQKSWSEYASTNLVLVLIDFPKNKALVPEKYVRRNSELAEKFGVQGFPTYVLLASTGNKELAKLGASRDSTSEAFIAHVEKLLSREPRSPIAKQIPAEKMDEAANAKDEADLRKKARGGNMKDQTEEEN